MTTALHLFLLALVVGSGAAAVLQRDALHQVLALGLHGGLLALMLLVLRAPDVALAQIAVGTVAVPLMFLAAIVFTRRSSAHEAGSGDADPPQGARRADGHAEARE